MGSNKVDFLHHPVAEQNVERLLLEPLDDPSDRFKYMHDYRKNNATEQGKCNIEGTNTQHGKKAGVLQVIEAESTTMDLSQYSVVEEKLYSIIRQQGLTPVSSPSSKKDTIVVVMKEGYVIARLYPKYKYCALDIHLWGAFQKSELLRSAIIEALGSMEESSYRRILLAHGQRHFQGLSNGPVFILAALQSAPRKSVSARGGRAWRLRARERERTGAGARHGDLCGGAFVCPCELELWY